MKIEMRALPEPAIPADHESGRIRFHVTVDGITTGSLLMKPKDAIRLRDLIEDGCKRLGEDELKITGPWPDGSGSKE